MKLAVQRGVIIVAIALVLPATAPARTTARRECTIKYSGNPHVAMVFRSANGPLAQALCAYDAKALGSGFSWAPGVKRFDIPTYPVCSYRTTSVHHSAITVSVFTTQAAVRSCNAASCTTTFWKPSVWKRVS